MELFVPGRLCLVGEHSDWAAGYRSRHPEIPPGVCIVSGTDQGLTARAERADSVLELVSRRPDGSTSGPRRIPSRLEALEAASRGGDFFSYAAGAAAELVRGYGVGGMKLAVRSDLPMSRGLSSSAAICVLVVRAYSRVYDLGLSPRDEMELAYRGERRAGSACGRMDQICAFGQGPVRLRFDGDGLEVEPLAVTGSFHLLVVDLGRGKDTRRILADLNACYPDTPGGLAAGVREALGARNLELAARTERALCAGGPSELGGLLSQAQAVFDEWVAPACPELRAPVLHEVLTHPACRELAYGGKGVGSQGDGCAQLVARGAAERTLLAQRLESELSMSSLPLTLGG
jgi:mevalonate kinase